MMIDNFDGPYAFLSNFFESPIEILIDGRLYVAKTVEHAFQAAKVIQYHNDEAVEIISAPTPGKAKRLGRRCHMRPDWDQVKDTVMLSLLRKKFADPVLAEKLLATGDEELVEGNWWGDRYWGVCVTDGLGQNKLGQSLMKVRAELKENM